MMIGAVRRPTGRWYEHPVTGQRYESVTSILEIAQNMAWAAPWGSSVAARVAVERNTEIGDLINTHGPAAAIGALKDWASAERDRRRDIGSHVHAVIEALILAAPIPDPPEHLRDDPDLDLDTIIDGWLQFHEDFKPEFLLAEATVAHDFYSYAGTLDAVVRVPGLGVVGIDVKAGKIKPHHRAQLAAYRNAETIWLDDLGNTAPNIAWDRAAILQLGADLPGGYRLVEVPASLDEMSWFLAARRVVGHTLGAHPVGNVIYPPLPDGTQPPPLLAHLPAVARYARALADAGVVLVTDLQALSDTDLQSLPGIGPAAIGKLRAAQGAQAATVDSPS